MALLGYGDRDSIEYGCGGSLISPNFIMTAAHCANRQDGLSIGWALLGATNRTSAKPKKNDTHQLIEVAEVIVHPEYVSSAKYHDIALLRLAEGAVVNQDDVRPACLDTDVDKDFTGEDAIATGWGATFFAGDGSESLLKVTLKVRDLQFCRDNINLDPKPLPRGLVDSMMCAGGGADGMDTCQGDSGGPLQVRADPRNSQTCIYRIIGVVSFGPACGLGKPAVYTRVAAYTEWIESIVWPTLPDGCARYAVGGNQGPVLIPNSGPGSVARGVCRGYHLDFCPNYWESGGPSVKPDLSRDSMCHHNHPKAGRTNRNPTTVTLGYGRSSYNSQFSCAGALVSPRAVLTAARCRALGCLPLSHVRLSHPLSCSGTLEFRVDSVRVHPEYRDGEAYADLAVALLAQSIDLRHYLPLCLDTPAHGPARPAQRAQAAGWNIQGFWEDISYNLDNTSLTVRTPEECSSALLGYGKLRQAHPRGVLPSQLCAGGICDNETYGGDSGVPLARSEHSLRVEKQQNRQYAVDRVLGVASSLTYCTARTPEGRPLPDLFTSVASHVTWIESVVWADQ